MSEYQPTGKVAALLARLRIDRTKLFTAKEVAETLQCPPYPSSINQFIARAVAAGMVFRINCRNEWLFAAQEITDEMLLASGRPPRSTSGGEARPSPFTDAERARLTKDARAPGPTGYVPPAMNAPRPGSEVRNSPAPASLPARPAPTPSPTPTPKRQAPIQTLLAAMEEAPDVPLSAYECAALLVCGPGQVQSTLAPLLNEQSIFTKTYRDGAYYKCRPFTETDDKTIGLIEYLEPAKTDEAAEGEVEAPEFDVAHWLDGTVVVYGAQVNEDGSFSLTGEQAAALRRMLPGEVAP